MGRVFCISWEFNFVLFYFILKSDFFFLEVEYLFRLKFDLGFPNKKKLILDLSVVWKKFVLRVVVKEVFFYSIVIRRK